jgi:hypothetical protein
MKRVLIIGSEGRIAKRYKAIFRWLGIHDTIGYDPVNELLKGDTFPDQDHYDRVMICSPTATHIDYIKLFSKTDIPILCEKPLATNMEDVSKIYDIVKENDMNFQMVNQYEYLLGHGRSGGDTEYDYYNSGPDGLYWDCLNIIGLATGKVRIGNTSPIWTCVINGNPISYADIEYAYVSMISNWLTRPRNNIDYAYLAHKRVEDILEANERSNWGASTFN